ncbi:23437_t:CDS:2 [Gigaspora margarita]|uniref:23437_t:CDS:1 n=1 Tax=Gigaspora margarita TaxID=4874 RepID=A0ABN7VJG5_GIGMA|nr:23437_t:CDS:2 [Gigaspora margarita]
MNPSIKTTIKEHGIHFCNFNEFTNVEKIDEGGYGTIQKANWKHRGLKVALKSLKVGHEKTVRAFIKELQSLFNITKHFHPNINLFHGVAKDEEKAFEILQQLSGGEDESESREHLKLTSDEISSTNSELSLETYSNQEISDSPLISTVSYEIKPNSQDEHIIKKEKFDLIAKWIDQSPQKFQFNIKRFFPSTNNQVSPVTIRINADSCKDLIIPAPPTPNNKGDSEIINKQSQEKKSNQNRKNLGEKDSLVDLKENINIVQTDTNANEMYNIIDNNIFNNIQFSVLAPIIKGSKEKNSWDYTDFMEVTKFISVQQSISSGTSSSTYIEVQRLFSLLETQKDAIDYIFNSHQIQVYAIGLDFQLDYLIPCIICWVAEHLDGMVMEQLSALFQNKFEIIEQIVKPAETDVNTQHNASIINEFENNELTNSSFSKSGEDKICKKDETNNGKNDDKENNGSVDDKESDEKENSDEDGDKENNRRDDDKENSNGNGDKVNSGRDDDEENSGGDDDKENSGRDDDKQNSGKDDSGGDDDGGGGSDDMVNSTKGIVITSTAKAVNKNNLKRFQNFSITTRIWANITAGTHNSLEFCVDVYNCTMGQMLSDKWKELHELGSAYFLDSIKIKVSPIPHENISDTSTIIVPKGGYKQPQELNRPTELSTSNEMNSGVEGQVGGNGIQIKGNYGKQNLTGIKLSTHEWEMVRDGCNETGVCWTYKFKANTLDKDNTHRRDFAPGIHSGEWYILNKMCGFKISITQILHHKFSPRGFHKMYPKSRSRLFRLCPKMAHTLEISFKNINDFNKNFAKLEEIHFEQKDLTVALGSNSYIFPPTDLQGCL